jgi:hypothetical protein
VTCVLADVGEGEAKGAKRPAQVPSLDDHDMKSIMLSIRVRMIVGTTVGVSCSSIRMELARF